MLQVPYNGLFSGGENFHKCCTCEQHLIVLVVFIKKVLVIKYRVMPYLHEVQIFTNFTNGLMSRENLCWAVCTV